MRAAPVALACTLAIGVATAVLVARDDLDPVLMSPARPVPGGLVSLDDGAGAALMFSSTARASFLPLAAQFVTQSRPTYCGMASLAMVLNALAVPAPPVPEYGERPRFTQDNVLGAVPPTVTTPSAVARGGMSLYQIAGVLRAYGLDAKPFLASEADADRFRALARRFVAREGHHVIVNYSRAALAQDGRGHISPLAAYHAEDDRFLVLDVARHRYPPVWVSTDRLHAAMAERAAGGQRSRGWVLVRRPPA